MPTCWFKDTKHCFNVGHKTGKCHKNLAINNKLCSVNVSWSTSCIILFPNLYKFNNGLIK